MRQRIRLALFVFLLALPVSVFAQRIPGPGGSSSSVPPAHGANLSWTASVTPSVTYNVYRATVSGGPYTQIATGLSGTTYEDSGLPGSRTFYYVVTAVNAEDQESSYSNEVMVTTL
jgi:hypothetical protein